MNIKISFALIAAAGLFCQAKAEFIRNPDANTLWLEDGRNIETSDASYADAWLDKHVKVEPLPDGGFRLTGGELRVAKAHSTIRRVPCSPEYPWLTFEVADIVQLPGRYRSWSTMSYNPAFSAGQASNPQKGVFSFNFFDGSEIKNSPEHMNLYLLSYSIQLDIKDLKMVKEPDYYIHATSPAFESRKEFGIGDKLKFTVSMKEPAEDVTLSLCFTQGLYTILLNGEARLQLKPEDREQRIWSAVVEVKSLTSTRKKGDFERGEIMLRAVILGGGISEPLWGVLNYPYRSKDATRK